MEQIEKTIFQLEERLQRPDVRKSVEGLNDLISEDFIEFGSSGQVYNKEDVLVNLPASPEIKFVMIDFRINIL
ncbi:MAG: nuclear transport factor 2 family protein [Candidatus Zambryskibacteria bacterium]|nr:nuclear transport factor 2 family protein [Candidatus Zambryskibacteria bacterium]